MSNTRQKPLDELTSYLAEISPRLFRACETKPYKAEECGHVLLEAAAELKKHLKEYMNESPRNSKK